MWACDGLPSILASLKSQQTLPVAVFSVSSTLPLFDAGAPSLLPFSAISNLAVWAAVAALAANTATSATAEITSAMSVLRIPLLRCVRRIRGRRGFGSPGLGDEMRLEHALDPRGARAALEPLDDALALHEGEGRHRLHLEALGDLGLLGDVDRGHAQ